MIPQNTIKIQQVSDDCGRSCDQYLFHICTVPESLDSEPSLAHLMDKVAAVIPSKYELVGLQLGLTLPQLQAIRPQHQSLEEFKRAFREVFREWSSRGSPPYTWRTIIGVLRSASVGEVLLSEKLTSWIASSSKITGGMRLIYTGFMFFLV